MALVYTQGDLEPEQVQETVLECAALISDSGNSMFTVFKDYAGEPCIINLMNVNKIKANE